MRLAALFTAATLLTLTVACGDDDGILQPDESGTPVATATPYAVQPNVIIVNGPGGAATTGTSTGTGGGASGSTGANGGTSQAGGEVKYVVQAGDTLIALAGRYGTTVEAIMTRNNIASASDLRAGQEIVIPSGQSTVGTPAPTRTPTPGATRTATAPAATSTAAPGGTAAGQQRYTVQSGDLAGSIAARFGVTLEQLAAANNRTVQSLDALNVGDVLNIPAR